MTSSVIKASQLYVLENESASVDSTTGDQNQVELLANIASEVMVKDDYCTFAVATHFKKQWVKSHFTWLFMPHLISNIF